MSRSSAGRSNNSWDATFSRPEFVFGVDPNAFLKSQVHLLRTGMRAIAVGDGEGRNGVWLAQQGLRVISIDRSKALAKASQLARSRGIALETLQANLLTWSWPDGEFDLVASIFTHFPPMDRQRIHSAYIRALRPGGLVILVAFTPAQLKFGTGGPEQADLLYTAGDLRAEFAPLEILVLEEAVGPLYEGIRHQGTAATVHFVGRKPPLSGHDQ